MILIVITVWLVIVLLLEFVVLPFLFAKDLISKHNIEDVSILFFVWPISLPFAIFMLVLFGITSILLIPSRIIFCSNGTKI